MTTRNLRFSKPAIGAPGPTFAQDVDDALQLIDDAAPVLAKVSTTVDADVTAAIVAAIDEATAGTDVIANPSIYIPRCEGRLTDTIAPDNSVSNVTVYGAGYRSTVLKWYGGNDPIWDWVNARGVVMRDLGLVGNTTPANRPTFGVRFHKAAGQVGAPGATEVLLERVFIGGYDADAVDTAVGFTADDGYDGNNDLGTFRDVFIQDVKTGYKFETTNAIWHTIIGGNVADCSIACIDNTPGPDSDFGGNYHVYGTRFGTAAGSGVVFRVGPVTGANSISIYGMMTEGAFQLIETPDTIGDESLTLKFFGGHAACQSGAQDTVLWDATGAATALEFHGFSIAAPSGVRFNFPSNGTKVKFFGGRVTTAEWIYNCDVIPHNLHETAGGPTFTNLGSGVFRNKVHTIGATDQPAFTNSWANAGGGLEGAGFTKDADGMVHLYGVINGGATATAAFTLPVGFRPAATIRATAWHGGSTGAGFAGYVSVATNGEVSPVIATTGSPTIGNVGLTGVSFKAA